jgi:uncharacterized protein (DUF2147 family)
VTLDRGANTIVVRGQAHRCRWRVNSRWLYVVVLLSLAIPSPAVSAGISDGVWLMRSKAAVQIFDCNGLLCGRIVWLQHARDAAGQLVRDNTNPDPTLRQRPLCGQTILWALRPAGPGLWNSGWLYNPDDGTTYRVKAELRSADTIVARIYLGVPLFGETWTFLRVPRLSSQGWC